MSTREVAYLVEKAAAGERLTGEEGLALYREADLLDLGMAANAARQRHVPGNIVTYLVDRNINYSNVCVTNCTFCGFYRPPGHPEAYVQSYEALGARVAELEAVGGTRILMQGGHNPDLPFQWYLDLLQYLRAHHPSVEINAFSPSEIQHFADTYGMSVREVLSQLKAAGLQGLPGGGGEILDDEIRGRVSPLKQKSEGWFSVMGEAHALGLATTSTMVIGFGEQLEHRMNHLLRLREVQEQSLAEHGTGFVAFISWTLQHSEKTSMGRSRHSENFGGTAVEYLRHAAISRLMLDNIPHHQASWVTQGPKIGQVSLAFGIDDFGSTMLEENVVSSASDSTYDKMGEREIHHYIRDAGYVPAKRDTSYNLLKVYQNPDESELVPSLPARRAPEIIPLAVR